jgi:hypothetical protein
MPMTTPSTGIPTVFPPLAPPGQWNDIQTFLGWQQPAWQEIERVDLTKVADKPTTAQCAQWAAMPAMQVSQQGPISDTRNKKEYVLLTIIFRSI